MSFQSELHSISSELGSIIGELEEIQGSLNTGNFEGIDIEACARVVGERLENYRTAKGRLDRVDVNNVEDDDD
ncbi:MAG: hypothetical protein K5705_01410 [Oscillospiraceae bacterium]|nr:hypothetical protein [Oscillospiraceae bacterium]MCR4758925.1 hypothetical protein [Oscillospiraceae bacterium]